MSKISTIYSLGKSYIKSFFTKSVKRTENTVFEQAEKTVQQTVEEPVQKATSKQIEAYYRRYGKFKISSKKVQPQTKETKQISELEKKLTSETDAYNQRRFIQVSKEALESLLHNFEAKRNKVIEIILANSEGLSTKYLQKIKSIKTPEELSYAVRSYGLEVNQSANIKYKNVIEELIKGKNLSLKTQQQIYNEEGKVCDVSLELIKAVTEPSKNPKVIQIENLIKSMYGMDFVHLENLDEAKRVLKVLKLAKQNNIQLPKNIIVTPFTPLGTTGINFAHNALNHTVVYKSADDWTNTLKEAYGKLQHPMNQPLKQSLLEEDKIWFSTDDELHIPLHEFYHSKQFLERLLPMRAKIIPSKYVKTINQVGKYASSSRFELEAELGTKSILRSLNKDEQEVFNYLI